MIDPHYPDFAGMTIIPATHPIHCISPTVTVIRALPLVPGRIASRDTIILRVLG